MYHKVFFIQFMRTPCSECDATLVCEKLDVSVLEKCVNEFETLKTYKLEVLGIVYA